MIKRFKTKSFSLYESLAQLYEGSIDEGNFNFTSTSAPSLEDVTEVSDDDESEGDIETETTERVSEDELQMLENPAPSAQSTAQVEREEVSGKKAVGASRNKLPKKPKRSPKKRSSDGIVQVMERLVHVKEKEANQEPSQKYSITKCMEAFKKLDGIAPEDKILALEVFKVIDNRAICWDS